MEVTTTVHSRQTESQVDASWSWSLLLVLVLAMRGFSPRTQVFPSPQKTNIFKFQFDLQSPQFVVHLCAAIRLRL